MFLKSILFWQPRQSLFKILCRTNLGTKLLIILNYLIWLILAFVSYLLIKSNANIFWQLLLATLFAEVVERFSKAFLFWSRPISKYKHNLPKGLVKSWYDTGSFPSGHTSKTFFFLLFLNQYQIYDTNIFLIATIPLLLFRVVVGFHYPIDILGGLLVGFLSWSISHQITFPHVLVNFIKNIFDKIPLL